jgi:hypothetical protein
MLEPIYDFLGQEVKEGDIIAVNFRRRKGGNEIYYIYDLDSALSHAPGRWVGTVLIHYEYLENMKIQLQLLPLVLNPTWNLGNILPREIRETGIIITDKFSKEELNTIKMALLK